MTGWIRNLRFVTSGWKRAIGYANTAPVRSIYQCRVCYGVSRSGFDNYEEEKASWNVKIPEKFNFVSDVLDVWAQKEKDGERTNSIPAFWFVSNDGREVKWSFQDLQRESKKVANMLLSCGVKRGDPVLVMLPKIPEFWLVAVASMRIGAISCPTNTQVTAKDLSYRLSSYRPVCLIAHESVAQIVEEATSSSTDVKTKILVSDEPKGPRKGMLAFRDLYKPMDSNHECVKTDSDETMMVFFTSGTTGYPKMVEHTHSSYGIGHQSTGKYMLDLSSENIFWNMSDTGWAKTAYGFFGAWNRGACVFIHQMPRFHPTQTLEILSKYPIDSFCGPPMGYRMMVQEDLKSYNFSKLAHCITGGEALNPEVNRLWKEGTGLNIYEGYGQTESVMLTGMFKCIDYKVGSMGKPSPGLNLVIIDENENEVGPDVEGEIAVKRTSDRIFGLFKGYRDEPELTRTRLTGKYFHTGDLGRYDENGYFYFVGRKDDLINSAGYRIGPFEVESALMEHSAVVEVAVTSSPDEERGEVVKAFVVLKSNYRAESEADLIKELQEHVKRVTAPYKYPRKIEFVSELPKTASGKIKRFELRKKEWETK